MNVAIVYAPVNGRDYHISTDGSAIKVNMDGAQGSHVPFTVRVIRVGTSTPVFHQTSAWRDDLNCESIGLDFPVSVGGYISYVENSMSDRQPPAAAFVVTP